MIFDNQLEPFDWETFMNERATLPSTNDLIGQHMLHLDRRLSEVLFKTESPALVECGQNVEPIQATIKSIVGSIAFVQFGNEKSLEEVKLDQLVIGISPYPTSQYSFDNLFSLRNLDINQLMKSIHSYVQVGHFFELIDKQNPRIVRTVKIIENYNGFVHVIDALGNSHSVLLSSERCKRIGWTLLTRNEGNFQLEPYLGTTIKTIVPWFLFDRSQLREHSVEVNQIFEVIDPITRYRIIPGIVTKIINKYFFVVGLIHSQTNQDMTFIICHRGSPDLLPANFSSKASLRLAIPEGYDDGNFTIYKIRGKHATENMLDIPKNVERFDTNRHIEIYDEEKKEMIPATILRQHRHLLVVRWENQRDFSSPKLYAYYDERVFNVGAAECYGIPLAKIPMTIDRTCWDFNLNYSIVTRPSLHDPSNGKRFICKAFSDASQFLPQLYVNYECYKGPFINEETARFIDTIIPSSHFQPTMLHIIHSVLENVIKFEYQKLAAAQPQSQAPTYTIKLTNPKSDKRSRTLQVEICESANQFPGWLRQFLLRLEICPNFISPVKRLQCESCPLRCDLIPITYPHMVPTLHIHTPATVSKNEEQRAKRQNITGPSSNTLESTGVPVKRSRNGLDLSRNSNHHDLDEPLSTRRVRRNIVPTKRHEIVMEESSSWKRKQLPMNSQQQSPLNIANPIRRKRNASTEFVHNSNTNSSTLKPALFNNQHNIAPRQQSSKEYLMEMANKIDEAIRGNLSTWSGASRERSSTPDTNGAHRPNEAIKAAVRKAGGGPRMLFPQQNSSTNQQKNPKIENNELPPRLQPAIQLDNDENFSDQSEVDELFIDDEGEYERELPRLSAIRPSKLEQDTKSNNKPQIQEYLRRIQNGQQQAPNLSEMPGPSSQLSIKLPPVQLAKPGEYDTELTPPKLQKKSLNLSLEIEELLEKYELNPTNNPANWQNSDLVAFMRHQHSSEVADFLEKEEFDGQSFFMIQDEEIKDMGLKRGPELNLKRLLKELKEISEAIGAK